MPGPAVRSASREPSLAPLGEAEVLDRVGHVDAGAIDSGGLETFVQDAPCRPDERLAFEVLPVARLLADQHHPGSRGALPEHGLGGLFPQVARPAAGGRLTQLGDASGPRRRLGHHSKNASGRANLGIKKTWQKAIS
jgi:hypothetical protein